MKKFLFLVIFLFFISGVYASCFLSPIDAKNLSVSYFISDSGKTSVNLDFLFDYTKECMTEYSIDKESIAGQTGTNTNDFIIEVQNDEFACPTKFREMIYEQLDEELLDLFCYAKFNNSQEMSLVLFGDINNLTSSSSQTNKYVFLGWDFLELIDNTSLLITKSSYSNFNESTIPEAAVYFRNFIYFSDAPKEKVFIELSVFDIENEFNNRLFPVLIISAFLVILSVAFSLFFIWKLSNKSNDKEKLKELRQKQKNLESLYMKGQMDDNTYKRLSEQYTMQANELITSIKKKEENSKFSNIFKKKE